MNRKLDATTECDKEKHEFFYIQQPDTYGTSTGLYLSKEHFWKSVNRGIPRNLLGVNHSTATSNMVMGPGMANEYGFPDGFFYPDLTTLRTHFSDPQTATVFGDFRWKSNDRNSERIFSCTRGILSEALEKLQSLGFKIYGTFEYEFYLFNENDRTPLYTRESSSITSIQNKYFSFGKEVMQQMRNHGMFAESFETETGGGQFEITMGPEYGIDIADNAVRFKELVKEIARHHGYFASFMSKPRLHSSTSSGHLNHSIWNEHGENLFYDKNTTDKLSIFFQNWMAGLQEHTNAITCLSVSTINCFNRLNGTFRPKNNSWGIDNRLASYRIKNFDHDSTYIENRIPGAATNPYLALAAVIYSGLDGIQRNLEMKCPSIVSDPAKDDGAGNNTKLTPLPTSLREAIRNLRDDKLLCNALGEKFLNCFIQLRECELDDYEEAEKQGKDWEWEMKAYFDHF